MTIHSPLLDSFVSEGRYWLDDCGAEMAFFWPAQSVLRAIAAHCEGGLPGFIATDPDLSEQAIRKAIAQVYSPAFADYLWLPRRSR